MLCTCIWRENTVKRHKQGLKKNVFMWWRGKLTLELDDLDEVVVELLVLDLHAAVDEVVVPESDCELLARLFADWPLPPLSSVPVPALHLHRLPELEPEELPTWCTREVLNGGGTKASEDCVSATDEECGCRRVVACATPIGADLPTAVWAANKQVKVQLVGVKKNFFNLPTFALPMSTSALHGSVHCDNTSAATRADDAAHLVPVKPIMPRASKPDRRGGKLLWSWRSTLTLKVTSRVMTCRSGRAVGRTTKVEGQTRNEMWFEVCSETRHQTSTRTSEREEVPRRRA